MALTQWTIVNSADVPMPQMMNLSTPEPSSTPSKKRGQPSTATRGASRYRVELHREVARVIARHATDEADVFRPSIAELLDELATNPKQFPKKRGALRRVRWLSLGPHDEAYRDAERRA
jgi:hypothetical protein